MENSKYADIFPLLNTEELNLLAQDIKENGLIDKIKIYNDEILGSTFTNLHALYLFLPSIFEILIDIDPLIYVISTNLKRRHLSYNQRGVIAVTYK